MTLDDWSHLEDLAPGGLRPPASVGLIDLYRAVQHLTPAKRLMNAQLLHDELIARSASLLAGLLRLPKVLTDHQQLSELTSVQYDRLTQMLTGARRPSKVGDLALFEQRLLQIRNQDGECRRAIGAALFAMYSEGGAKLHQPTETRKIDAQIDGIFSARIGIRFLLNHYLAAAQTREGWSGNIHHHCSPGDRCAEMAAAVTARCAERHGRAPQILLHADRAQTFTFVPEHLDYVLRELLMNASKATLRQHEGRPLPPVRVVVAGGDDAVTIKVADEGGGLRRSKLGDVWSYQGRWKKDGKGLGLPLARLYAKYFGGSLYLTPVEGFGTDCYAFFNSRLEASYEGLLEQSATKEPVLAPHGHVEDGKGLFDAQMRRL